MSIEYKNIKQDACIYILEKFYLYSIKWVPIWYFFPYGAKIVDGTQRAGHQARKTGERFKKKKKILKSTEIQGGVLPDNDGLSGAGKGGRKTCLTESYFRKTVDPRILKQQTWSFVSWVGENPTE